ncbi:MAG: J domain-containing protein [Nitrosomonas sp.]|nr:J domain-containing protein [Nitrosomonas sp.]
MKQFHTHYDNLKVSHNAPPEIIRAAYKTLSQKFHPDRNAGNSESARIMAIINTSYEVLSDPVKRREHDLWITEMEKAVTNNDHVNRETHPSNNKTPNNISAPILHKLFLSLFNHVKILFIWAFNYSIGIGIVVGVIWLIGSVIDIFGEKDSPPQGLKPYQASPPSIRPEYIRPSMAPNGQPWPSSASYIKGYQRLITDGFSTVTIDNIQNNSDVFVKLVSLDSPQAYPVRQFYIPSYLESLL